MTLFTITYVQYVQLNTSLSWQSQDCQTVMYTLYTREKITDHFPLWSNVCYGFPYKDFTGRRQQTAINNPSSIHFCPYINHQAEMSLYRRRLCYSSVRCYSKATSSEVNCFDCINTFGPLHHKTRRILLFIKWCHSAFILSVCMYLSMSVSSWTTGHISNLQKFSFSLVKGALRQQLTKFEAQE